MKAIVSLILIVGLSTFNNCDKKTNTKSPNSKSIKIGDYWIYQHKLYGFTGNVKNVFSDTVIIQSDTLIGNVSLFKNNKGELVKVVNNRIETYNLLNSIENSLFPECKNENYPQKVELIGKGANGFSDTTRFNLLINCLNVRENCSIKGFLLDCSFYSSIKTKSINKPRRNFSKRNVYYNNSIGKIKEIFWSDNRIEYEVVLLESSLLN